LAAFLYVRSHRTARALAWAAGALTCREDVALVVIALAIYALVWTRPRQPALAAGLAGAALSSLALTWLVLRPAFSHGEAEYAGVYAHWGDTLGSALAAMASRPFEALASLVCTPGRPTDTAIKLQYHFALLAPQGFLPLASPATLLVALPAYAEHM